MALVEYHIADILSDYCLVNVLFMQFDSLTKLFVALQKFCIPGVKSLSN